MVDYMSLEEQVATDFGRAHRKAVPRRLLARLRGDTTSERLPRFEEVRRKFGAAGGVRLGRRVVCLADIVGSAGRHSEFDSVFLPISERARTRWERIDRAFYRGEELPPVSLYKVGDSYFAEDGTHRISVTRYHGVEWIDAEVTVFRARLPERRRGTHVPTSYPKGGDQRREKCWIPRSESGFARR